MLLIRKFLYWRLLIRHRYYEYRLASRREITNEREEIANRLKMISPASFQHYQPAFGLPHNLILHFRDLKSMVIALGQLADAVKIGNIVDRDFTPIDRITHNLDDWLTLHDGRYVDIQETIAYFLEEAERALKLLKEHDHQTVGVHATNRRYATRLIQDLSAVSSSLIHVSLECLA